MLVGMVGLSLALTACSTLEGMQRWLAGASDSAPAAVHGETASATTQADEPLHPALQATVERLQSWQDYGQELGQRLDPQQGNWEIEELPLSGQRVHLRLRMKRFHTGGAGEAELAFKQRARDLVSYGGYSGYRILEYSEGIESLVGGARRVAGGVIELQGKAVTQDVGSAVNEAPATPNSSARAAKPRS